MWIENLFWCIVGIIGGAIVSAIFYYISKNRKVITYEIVTTTLIASECRKLKKLKISYKNIDISSLYVSTIKIKNTGNHIIENSDFAPTAPLSIKTNGVFLVIPENDSTSSPLLSIITDDSFSITSKTENTDIDMDTTTILSSNSYNKVYPIPQFNENNICTTAKINFDYISKKEVITSTVFHTGSISVTGKLKDGKIIKDEKTKHRIGVLFSLIFSIVGGILGAVLSYISFMK